MNVYGSTLSSGGKVEYSTSEQIIGKWITGETLYQKTVTVTCPTVTTAGVDVGRDTSLSSVGLSSLRKCIELSGYIYIPSTNAYREINCTNQNATGVVIYTTALVNLADGAIRVNSNMPVVSDCTAYLTLKYTK